ncbi:hypothetical protein KRX57_04675 [Weeksellaceae bacterium TAE3-ERU29]|nr:hypothetical protein [Weeksellaceae bacterium TAE3-ERU29]
MRLDIVSLFFLFCIGCKKDYNSEMDNIKYINEKYVLIDNPSLLVSDDRYCTLENNRYPIEEIVKYDSLGKAIEVFKSGSEGFIIYQKEHIKNKTLPFTNEMWEYSIRLSAENKMVIDNNDSLAIEKITEDKIITKPDKNNRFRIYTYESN